MTLEAAEQSAGTQRATFPAEVRTLFDRHTNGRTDELVTALTNVLSAAEDAEVVAMRDDGDERPEDELRAAARLSVWIRWTRADPIGTAYWRSSLERARQPDSMNLDQGADQR